MVIGNVVCYPEENKKTQFNNFHLFCLEIKNKTTRHNRTKKYGNSTTLRSTTAKMRKAYVFRIFPMLFYTKLSWHCGGSREAEWRENILHGANSIASAISHARRHVTHTQTRARTSCHSTPPLVPQPPSHLARLLRRVRE